MGTSVTSCRRAVGALDGMLAQVTPAMTAVMEEAEMQGVSRWAAAPRLWRLCVITLPATRPVKLGVREPTSGAIGVTITTSIVPSNWSTLELGLAGAVLRMRRRRRSTGLLWPALADFFTMIVVLMSPSATLEVAHATASSASLLAIAHFYPPCGRLALPSVVLPKARTVARPAAPWNPVASKAGTLGAKLMYR